jgi:serine/threonine protein kinase
MTAQSDGLLREGEIVGERYRVEKVVGRGAFAAVYKGTDIALERSVAIKLLNPSKLLEQQGGGGEAMRAELVERFYREARTVAKMRDEHAVTLYDFGSTPHGGLYMVLEFVDGCTLRDEVDTNGPLTADRVVDILRQSLECLREAHSYGMLHRDIKPENMMIFPFLGDQERVRLVDFGIAKALETEEGSDLTAAGVLIGTPRYVAPERVNKKELGPASDIYSLGIVAYELLVGAEPFHGLKGIEVLRAQLAPDPVRLPADVQEKLPDALVTVIHKMLEKDLARRYSTAKQVLDDLIRVHNLFMLEDVHQADPHEFAKTSRMAAVSGVAPPEPQRTEAPGVKATGPQTPVQFGFSPSAAMKPDFTPPAPGAASGLSVAELAAREKKAQMMLVGGGIAIAVALVLCLIAVLVIVVK